jgi:hypothetical protein
VKRSRIADVVVGLLLLVAAVVPVSSELTRRAPLTLTASGRAQVAWETLNREAVAAHEVPLWNPYQFSGRPHLADPATLALYPPHLLLRLLPLHLMFPISFVLHAWLAGFGGYLAGRFTGASRIGALALAVAIALAGVLAPRADIAYSPETIRLAWLPLVAAFAIRSVMRPAPWPHPALVLVTVLAAVGSVRGPLYAGALVAACYAGAALWRPAAVVERRLLVRQMASLVVLVIGIGAFQLLPTWRSQIGAWRTGGFADDPINSESRHLPVAKVRAPAVVVAALSANSQGRVLSTCEEALDGSQVVAAHVRSVDGYGGLFPADYGRFVNLARGAGQAVTASYGGIPEAGAAPARADLLRLLGAQTLVACSHPDPSRWGQVATGPAGAIYGAAHPLPRAFWTCAPASAGRQEIERRLRGFSYDDTLTLRAPRALIHVRWPADMEADERTRLESELHLQPVRSLGDRTWQYDLLDTSPANVAAIVQHPRVEDTAHLDRGALVVDPAAPPVGSERRDQWLLGATACEGWRAATVLEADRLDGRMTALVDAPAAGIVFLSEPFYDERRAWVDGHAVTPLKVNLAFTAVPIGAGPHRIELAYDSRPMYVGIVLSTLSLVWWVVGECRMCRRSWRQ